MIFLPFAFLFFLHLFDFFLYIILLLIFTFYALHVAFWWQIFAFAFCLLLIDFLQTQEGEGSLDLLTSEHIFAYSSTLWHHQWSTIFVFCWQILSFSFLLLLNKIWFCLLLPLEHFFAYSSTLWHHLLLARKRKLGFVFLDLLTSSDGLHSVSVGDQNLSSKTRLGWLDIFKIISLNFAKESVRTVFTYSPFLTSYYDVMNFHKYSQAPQ